MSHGAAGVQTLYDKNGNPVTVTLIDDEYRLRVYDFEAVKAMQELKTSIDNLHDLFTTFLTQ